MASPNGKKPLVSSSTDTSLVIVPEEEYANTGYIGSKASFAKQLPDSKEEVTIMLGDSTKSGLDDSGSSDSVDSTEETSGWTLWLESCQEGVDNFYREHQRTIGWVSLGVLFILFKIYFIWALVLDFERATALFVITILAYVCAGYMLLKRHFGEQFYESCVKPIITAVDRVWYILKWIIYVLIAAGLIVFLALDVQPHYKQLIPMGGLAMFLAILFIFSASPAKVSWRPVLWGMGLQFIFGVLILRTKWGYSAFSFVGKEIDAFLKYTDAGSKFVFGNLFEDHFFAFKVLPVIVFFSCVISTLYYLGIMQVVISKIAWVMQVTMGTAATESLSCAGNIFVGQTEAPILIRPFLKDMTKSELHAVMTGGFATIAGGVLAAYIMFGVPAEHLLCASVMNAPIALAVSKLFYPETEKSKTKKSKDITQCIEKGPERNLIEAAAGGASASIKLVANIAANLIAFLAMLAFVNAVLSWLGSMVGYPELSFQLICSYVFMPIAFMMGVEWEDCGLVAELLGIKTFLNEFVAYEKLSEYIKNRKECNGLEVISVRSEIIATYALCGFANMSSIGIQLGGIGPMAPSRRGDLADIAVRALVAGTIATFMTACVAGILTPVSMATSTLCVNSTMLNATMGNITMLNSTAMPLNATVLDVVLNSTIAGVNSTVYNTTGL